jgi:hypothetical protein
MRGSKRLIVSLLPAGLCLILGSASRSNPISQDAVQLQKPIQHDVSVVNIEVPVRVFKGDTFIDHLTIGDFEVFDDGVLQQIDARSPSPNFPVSSCSSSR